jgi:deoxyribose-phosphate aldolase
MFENASQLAQLIDHTLVRPDATITDLARVCNEAKQYGFSAVVVNGGYVARAREMLSGTMLRVCAVVGFPHGANTTTVKIVEAMEAMKNGASELDIVINLGMLKSGRLDIVEIDIKNILAMTPKLVHKIILETGYLTPDEITTACTMAARVGSEFVKTSTGYGPRGATVEDVRLMCSAVGTSCRVKASGSIRDLNSVNALVKAGAVRIGTSSSVTIMEEYLSSKR